MTRIRIARKFQNSAWRSLRIPYTLAGLLLTLGLWGSVSPVASAFEIGAGLSVVEEGDDRLRPAANIHLAPSAFYYGRLYVWGREYGPVVERSILINGARRWGIFKSKSFLASFGGALLSESTTINYEDSDEFDVDDNRFNFGPLFGLEWLLTNKKGLRAALSWDSHLFAAGSGGLFLAYGRKQAISFNIGAAF